MRGIKAASAARQCRMLAHARQNEEALRQWPQIPIDKKGNVASKVTDATATVALNTSFVGPMEIAVARSSYTLRLLLGIF